MSDGGLRPARSVVFEDAAWIWMGHDVSIESVSTRKGPEDAAQRGTAQEERGESGKRNVECRRVDTEGFVLVMQEMGLRSVTRSGVTRNGRLRNAAYERGPES